MKTPAVLFAVWILTAPLFAVDRFTTLPARLQPFVDRGEIAGAVMLVADRDHILHLSAIGKSDLASGRAMQTDAIFVIASMTKPITAVAVAILVDDGRLSFDDPVEKFLPEFRDLWVVVEESENPPRRVLERAPRPITVRDLLTHTSGVAELEVPDPHWTLSEAAKAGAREPLRFAPGTHWEYCSRGIAVLGRIVEVVTGESFAGFLQHRIFTPLAMNDTTFCLSPEQRKRLANCYRANVQTGRLERLRPPPSFGDPTDCSRGPNPAGGLLSIASDIAAFYQMLLGGGGRGDARILRPETAAELTRRQTGDLRVRPGMSWGLGFCIIDDPSRMEANRTFSRGSFGHGGMVGTSSWADPTRGIIHVFMMQLAGLPNPNNSPMRQAYEQAVAESLAIP
jgi:CubicO group peptidase (beta-lactamase class C family)